MLHFILDFKSPNKEANFNIRNFEEIVAYYINTTFYMDLLPLVPLQALRIGNNVQNIFFAIKLVRIRKGIMSVSIVEIVKSVKDYINRRNERRTSEMIKKINTWKGMEDIDKSTTTGILAAFKQTKDIQVEVQEAIKQEDAINTEDHNMITHLLIFGFFLKIFKLFFFISSLAFFLAMTFRMVLTIENDLFKGEDFYEIDGNCQNDSTGGYFAKCYNLNNMGGPNSRTI